MRLAGSGVRWFAIATAGLAIVGLSFHGFAPLWQPLPAWLPWHDIWVDACGLLLLAASVGLCFRRTLAASVLVIAVYCATWAVTRAVAVVHTPLSFGAWYGVFEALAPFVAALMLGARLGQQALRVAQVLFGVTCVVFGAAHFVYADFTASMVPGWLPGHLGLAYFTGLGHMAAGVGIATGILPRLAARLEALMMSLFGLLVWVPTLFARSPPQWATPPQNQWSELVLTLLLAVSALIVATSLRTQDGGGISAKPGRFGLG
jgi:uncharacterized membrane protein